ncbi:uncharacterized protein C1orf131 homolog isoform X2 [Argiope bruennichi]|uniref:Uncharacterized protein n=1 Tax=Argiope bruennichi TaxID=94029 RepID=A0A8T0FST0_ARGBR|nr:uncharacterized protein C1orf131 homolog isoform X2 [Argiope bruennichi]KAF8794207.1 hypothetical protein HNY73_002209 [Argiope bruennichi]
MSISEAPVEIIQFNARFCGRKIQKENNKLPEQDEKIIEKEDISSNVKEFNIKRARYEVMRFGLSGFDKEKQKRDKISMAIRLGAKPPKKEYVNYKQLIEQKKKEKEEKKAKQTDQYVLKQLKGRKKVKGKKKMTKNPSSII